MNRLLVFQTDFGLSDGAVAAMYGVALSVDEDLKIFNLTHDIPPFDTFEASYRLFQAVPYWPQNTVFVTVVDPGVGSSRRSIVARTKLGHAGWHAASANYAAFLKAHEGQHMLFLELGVGGNTPVIIKYPFWAMTAENPQAVYACLNRSEAVCPKQILDRSICIDGDTGAVLQAVRSLE